MDTSFRERLTLDAEAGAWFDQTRRYMLIRPDALMGVFRHLPAPERDLALNALEASIFEQGGHSARAYLALGGDGAGLLDVIARSAPQLGWGIWQFSHTGDTIALTVRNSPFATGFGSSPVPVCHAIVGMVRAVASLVFDTPAWARETVCAAMAGGSGALCRFEAGRLSHDNGGVT